MWRMLAIVLVLLLGTATAQNITYSTPYTANGEISLSNLRIILDGAITFSQRLVTLNLTYMDISNPAMQEPILVFRGPVTCPGGSPVVITPQLFIANVLRGPRVGTVARISPFIAVESTSLNGCVITTESPAKLSTPLGNYTQCIPTPIAVDTTTAQLVVDFVACSPPSSSVATVLSPSWSSCPSRAGLSLLSLLALRLLTW